MKLEKTLDLESSYMFKAGESGFVLSKEQWFWAVCAPQYFVSICMSVLSPFIWELSAEMTALSLSKVLQLPLIGNVIVSF